MLKTIEAVLRPDRTLWLKEPLKIDKPHRALITFLDEEVVEEEWTAERREALRRKIEELSPESRRSLEDFVSFLYERCTLEWRVEGDDRKEEKDH